MFHRERLNVSVSDWNKTLLYRENLKESTKRVLALINELARWQDTGSICKRTDLLHKALKEKLLRSE